MPYVLDAIIAIVVTVCVVRGAKRGFIRAAFGILTFLLAAVLSFMFYVPFSEYIINTPTGQNVSQSLNDSIYKAVSGKTEDTSQKPSPDTANVQGSADGTDVQNGAGNKNIGNSAGSTTEEIIKAMSIPKFMFSSVYEQSDFLMRTARLTAAQAVSESLTKAFMKALSGILLFILILIGLWILRILLEFVFKLPLLKEVNKLAGFIAGLVNGVLVSYLILALFASLSGFGELSFIKETSEQSYIYKNLYQTNIILEMFSK